MLVLDAIEAVQAQTDTVWRQMQRRGLPALGFVNKCERAGADFLAVAGRVQARLGIRAAAVMYPCERDGQLVGMADVIGGTSCRAVAGGEECGLPLDPEFADEVAVLRAELIEVLAEDDETLLECVVGGQEPTAEQIHQALRAAVLARRLLPLFGGVALQGLGVHCLLDGVVRYLPSPLDRPPVCGWGLEQAQRDEVRRPAADEPFSALAFKTHTDNHGDSVFVRVYSGTLEEGGHVWQPRTGKGHRVRELRRMHADSFERVPRVGPGRSSPYAGRWGSRAGTPCATRNIRSASSRWSCPNP
ncbi:MAG: GTP-binding protein [Planctomycetota bacterium]